MPRSTVPELLRGRRVGRVGSSGLDESPRIGTIEAREARHSPFCNLVRRREHREGRLGTSREDSRGMSPGVTRR
jgi:hypothetical protein